MTIVKAICSKLIRSTIEIIEKKVEKFKHLAETIFAKVAGKFVQKKKISSK